MNYYEFYDRYCLVSPKIESKNKGKKFADDVLGSLLLILLFIVTIVEIFTPYLIYINAPGFIENQLKILRISGKKHLMIYFGLKNLQKF